MLTVDADEVPDDARRMSVALSPPPRLRPRKLTQRGANARERIVTAMIACIVRSGFAATTVEHVMAEAGLSRGSVLHQFPTRLELVVASAEHAMRRMMDAGRAFAAAIDDPYDRLACYADNLWANHSHPHGLAVTDILLATRWDADLAQALLPVTSEIELQIQDEFLKLAREAGVADPQAFVPYGWLLLASVRGLIIEHKLNPERPMILEAIEVMKAQHRQVCEDLCKK
ncbi:TetR family transcriptional regulator [Novosphingobium kunmingense]|uniref:TetR family transcriptional regulator n=1 Tax=Novosphingobium kunmingense TaxID=1211806 RepID=A0A2N0H3D5_9SPHN|nr:TetR/AcrR family transcriptional regulator [Novosphingobium kunmingense]PKB13444.1 TetR family transcriptional regulator [Novosphingobium kunmingense]